MAVQPLPCDSCGSPISDSDLETGTAITLLGKRYCPGCKTEAIQSVSLEDLAVQRAPARGASAKPPSRAPNPTPHAPAASPEVPQVRPAPPRASAAPGRVERKGQPRGARPAGNRPRSTLLWMGGVGVAVVVCGIAFIALNRGDGDPASPAGTTGRGHQPSSASVAAPGPDRDRQARDAYTRVEEIAHSEGVSWARVLAAAEMAAPVCRATPWAPKLEELRGRARHEKESEDAARELAPLIDELKGAVATDFEFKRYAELQPKFRLALEIAGKTQSVRMTELRALHLQYTSKYEKLAEPYYDRINEAATALADEHRYGDALRQIDSFPQQYRQSGAWQNLERLRQDIERRRQAQSKK